MKVSELFSHWRAWTQGVPARDADGNRVEPRDERAVKWDLLGAIAKCYPPAEAHDVEMRVRHHLFQRKDGKLKLGDCLSLWNDNIDRTFKDVIRVVRALDI